MALLVLRARLARTHVCCQTIACVFNQIKHVLKTSSAIILGIWDHGAVMLAAKLAQSAHLVMLIRRACMLGECQVVPIHHHNQIKDLKVACLYRARPQILEVVAAPFCVLL